MWSSSLTLWVDAASSTARMFDTPKAVDTCGRVLHGGLPKNQSLGAIVHNPHAYCFLLPNPTPTYKEMWNDEISM